MTKIFYLSEILKFAIEKEKESEALYKALSGKVSVKEMKDLFHQLMLEEVQHEDFYTKLLAATPKEQTPRVKEDAEYEAYMQEMIRESRFTPPLNLEKLTDMKVAIDYGIAREKESVLFYVGLKNYLPSHEEEKIDVIIKEETQHMIKLLLLKKHL
jgi:rubrerythrin